MNKIFCQPAGCLEFEIWGNPNKWISIELSRWSRCPSKISWSFDFVWVLVGKNRLCLLVVSVAMRKSFFGMNVEIGSVCGPSDQNLQDTIQVTNSAL